MCKTLLYNRYYCIKNEANQNHTQTVLKVFKNKKNTNVCMDFKALMN
jgi:hypothetical protein